MGAALRCEALKKNRGPTGDSLCAVRRIYSVITSEIGLEKGKYEDRTFMGSVVGGRPVNEACLPCLGMSAPPEEDEPGEDCS